MTDEQIPSDTEIRVWWEGSALAKQYQEQLARSTPRHTDLAFALQRAAGMELDLFPAPLYLAQAFMLLEQPELAKELRALLDTV